MGQHDASSTFVCSVDILYVREYLVSDQKNVYLYNYYQHWVESFYYEKMHWVESSYYVYERMHWVEPLWENITLSSDILWFL
jgi:hypothetical protein